MKVKWIKFNDNPRDPDSKDYYPELEEVIAMFVLSPFTWAFVLLILYFTGGLG